MQQRYLSDLEQLLENTNNLTDACQILQELLSGPFSATGQGEFYEVKGQIAIVGNVKLSINSNEHAPPHFHISHGNENGLFSIADCRFIEGNAAVRTKNIIYGWYNYNRQLLIKKWDASRPSDCPVGTFKE